MMPARNGPVVDAIPYPSNVMGPARPDSVAELSARAAAECAGESLRRASRAISRFYEPAFARVDLSATQFSILVAVKPLVRRGRLRILPGQTRRERTATLTEAGRRLLADALPIWEQVQGRLVGAQGPGPGPRSHRDFGRSSPRCRPSSPAPAGGLPSRSPSSRTLVTTRMNPVEAVAHPHMMHTHRQTGSPDTAENYVGRERNQMSFVLAHPKPGVDAAALTQRITAQTGLLARTRDEWAWATIRHYLANTGIPVNFGITISLAFLVGAVVAGQTFYLFTIDNLKQFGALKAIGVSNRRLVGMILLQALIVGVIGYGLGMGLAAAFLESTKNVIHLRGIVLLWPVMLGTGGAVLVIIVLASLMSIRRVLILEPAAVFR
jgi:FtsX-like permease family